MLTQGYSCWQQKYQRIDGRNNRKGITCSVDVVNGEKVVANRRLIPVAGISRPVFSALPCNKLP
jgi:hypothetical protein